MVKKKNKYSNPFFKDQGPLLAPLASQIPNLDSAISAHQQGMLSQAEVMYRKILEVDPRNQDALHLLGVIALQSGNYQFSIEMIEKAIQINPNVASYHSNKGIAFQELKQFYLAVTCFDKAISLNPLYANAYSNRGNALQGLKLFDGAIASYNRAIEIKPDLAEAYSNRGNVQQELKQFDLAVTSYDEAIKIKPDYLEAYFNRGNALQELKLYDDAVASYNKAITINPNHAEAFCNRGNALQELKQLEAAILSFDTAIYLKNDYAEAYSNRGNALQGLKLYDDAIANYNKAIELKPDLAEAFTNRGISFKQLKQLNAALDSYEKAIALKPENALAYCNRGNALQEMKQLDAAIASYDNAIALKPDYAIAFCNKANALQELKKLGAALLNYDKALSLKSDYEYLFGIRLHLKMQMCYWEDFENEIFELGQKINNRDKVSPSYELLSLPISLSLLKKATEIWSKDKYPYNPILGEFLKSSRKEKILIGYYSADFHNHATSHLMAELFEIHDKNKFGLIAFSFGPVKKDEMRNRLNHAFDQFIDVTEMSDIAVAQLSRELSIDIAVDLKGFTQDSRLGIFAYKAAPIQVSYLGYPGTLGAEYIDYLIADKTLIPIENQQYYSEKIVYMPDSYQVNDRKREVALAIFTREELGLPPDAFVFCCFNNNFKITPDVFDTWSRILRAVDGSVLWLYQDNPDAAKNLQKQLELKGLNSARLVFAKRMQTPEHLARYKVADLFLDTLPYNAHTTASDALWVGLPVLTCKGESFASRVAASLLYSIHIPELVTDTLAEYELLAIEIASNPDKLKAIKEKLMINRLTTPLFDTPLFSRHIENAYLQMYERYHDGLQPEHIFIDP